MKYTITTFNRTALTFLAAGLLATSAAIAQFPSFPPSNVTSVQDRDQMMWQLGLSYSALPPKLQDPNAPPNTHPANASSPEGNWTDAAGHTITRSGHGLWNNYDNTAQGFFPGPESLRVGVYTPIDLLKMHDGTRITTPEQWWALRRPEVFKDVREQLWGVIPPDSILPAVTWSVTTSTGGSGSSAYREKVITGTIDVSRYPKVRNVPKISATLRIPANATKPVPVMVVNWTAGNFFKWMGPLHAGSYLPRRIELCPVDAHSLLALCAPRPVFLNGGTQDSWTDPYGIYLTGVGATPVYELLEKRGLLMPEAKPRVDVGYILGDIAYRYHNGGHTDAPDWPAFFQFAVKYINPNTSVDENELGEISKNFQLLQNYPNPFSPHGQGTFSNPSTTISLYKIQARDFLQTKKMILFR